MHFQWYPGHMSKAKRQMQEDLKLIDVVIELVDARIPYSSKNPDIDTMAKNKLRILLLNKADLSDRKINEAWKRYYEKRGYHVLCLNSKTGTGLRPVHEMLQTVIEEKQQRDKKRGILNRPVRAMIVGIPNVGKSTFINSCVGKACTKTGNKPGITKGKQWIRINKQAELLDTPGILWPKFEDQTVGERIAWIGSINDEILIPRDLCITLCRYLLTAYPGALAQKYKIDENADAYSVLQRIAIVRGCIMRQGIPDEDKASSMVLDDFRNAKIGCFSLEIPKEEAEPSSVTVKEEGQHEESE